MQDNSGRFKPLEQEVVENIFRSYGCILLDEYKKSSVPLIYKCHCGKISKRCLSDFKKSPKCNKCPCLVYSDIKEIFERENCKLISTEYINARSKLKYICSCGNISEIVLHSFKNGNRCKQCGRKKLLNLIRYTFDELKKEIEDTQKYKVISDANEYINIKDSKIKFSCNKCGNIFNKDMYHFRKWKGCRHRKDGLNALKGRQCYQWKKNRKLYKLEQYIKKKCLAMLRRTLKILDLTKNNRSYRLLGYDHYQLKEHIESLPNWGKYKNNQWHLDHIFPIKAFLDYGIEDVKLINSLDNLNILSPTENIRKSCKYDKKEFEQYLKSKGIVVNINGNI